MKVYDAKWRVFTKWCASHGQRPLEISIQKLADFFLFLRSEKGLSPITIKGYRSMLSNTLRHYGRHDIGTDASLSDLLANIARTHPVHRSLVPRWNLPWVLTWLSSGKFEPLPLAPLNLLTKKTVFLLALASASRVSELHALSCEDSCLQFRQDGSVSLTTAPGFVAKNRLPSVGNQSITIPSLQAADRSRAGKLHDPVRALRVYLRRTRPFRRGRSRLFLPLRQAQEDITAQTVSSWIRWVVKNAYADLAPDRASRLHIKAHEVRAVATSTALDRNCALRDIIGAVGWRSDSTFAASYLRDLSSRRASLDLVGPVVAVQHVA